MAKLEDAFHSVQGCVTRIGEQQERYRQIKDLFQATVSGDVETAQVATTAEAYAHIHVQLSKDNLQTILAAEANQIGEDILLAWDDLFRVIQTAQEAVHAVRQHAMQQASG
jgi:hypothetical protein